MMANMPIFQDMAAGVLAGAAKPVAAAAEGVGVDFAALLAGVETDKDGAPGQAVAATRRPDFVTAVLEQRHADQADNSPIVGKAKPAELTSGPQAAVLDDGVPNPLVAAGTPARQASGTEDLPEGTKLPMATAPAPDRPVKQSTPARFAHVTSVLPQVANAINAGPASSGKVEHAALPEEEPGQVADTDSQAKASPAPQLMQGLALPLLQGLESPAPVAARVAAGRESQAHSVAPSAAGRSIIAGVPPKWAAQPAHIHAQVGRAKVDLSSDAGANSSGVSHAAAQPAHNRQALALDLAVSSLGQGFSDEKAPATPLASAGRTEAAGDGTILPPAPASLAEISPASAVSVDMPGTAEIATPLAPAIATADTGAMLGEQVIDMGVEGQWIDQMAREIAEISAGTGRASFTLNPENLGRLQVDILQRDDGADVRLIADTDEAAAALSQGRQQLQQDARLQAVRIHDVHIERAPVERGQTESGGLFARSQATGQDMTGQQGQSQPFHKKPLIEAVSSRVTGQEQDQAASERTRSQHARYA